MPLFKAAISRGANLINPDTIEIADRLVIFKIRRAIDFQKIIQAPRDYDLHGEDPQNWRSDNWGTK